MSGDNRYSGVLGCGHLAEAVRLHPDPNRHPIPAVARLCGAFPRRMSVVGFAPLTAPPVGVLASLLVRPTKIKAPAAEGVAAAGAVDDTAAAGTVDDPTRERGFVDLLAASLFKEKQVAVVRLGTGTALGLLVPHKKKKARGAGGDSGAGAGAGAGTPSAKKRRRRGKDTSATGGGGGKASGLYLVLDVCAGDVVMDVAPAGKAAARDGGMALDPGAAAAAVSVSGPLAHGLPLTTTDVNEAVQTFVVMTANLPSRGDAYMATVDRLIAAAYTWYGGELLDLMEQEVDAKHAALKAENKPGTGRASTRALAAKQAAARDAMELCVAAKKSIRRATPATVRMWLGGGAP